MEAPLPEQPDPSASAVPQQNRRRTSKKKAARDFKHQHAAEDWVRSLASRGVWLTHTQYKVLFELAQWCGPEYGFEVRPWVFNPTDSDGNPLLDEDGNLQLGMLSRLDLEYHSLLKHLGRLQRICEPCRTMHSERRACGQDGLITKTVQGRGNRGRAKNRSLPSAYLLNVLPIATSKQEPLFRTESHGPIDSPMPKVHGPTGRPLLNTSNRSHTSKTKPPPTSSLSARDSRGGEEGGGSFCSNFLIPSFENVGLTGFTETALDFVEAATKRFAEIHARQLDKDVADYMAARLVKFIQQEGIDISLEPERILGERGGWLRKTLVPSVLESGLTLRFTPADIDTQSASQAETNSSGHVKPDWRLLHTGHIPNAVSARHPKKIWDVALGELQLQVARPAFETWLRDTDGVGITDGEFYVGTANDFVAEMLEHRMYPLIERAVEHIAGELLAVRFVVVPTNIDHTKCPLCEEKR